MYVNHIHHTALSPALFSRTELKCWYTDRDTLPRYSQLASTFEVWQILSVQSGGWSKFLVSAKKRLSSFMRFTMLLKRHNASQHDRHSWLSNICPRFSENGAVVCGLRWHPGCQMVAAMYESWWSLAWGSSGASIWDVVICWDSDSPSRSEWRSALH